MEFFQTKITRDPLSAFINVRYLKSKWVCENRDLAIVPLKLIILRKFVKSIFIFYSNRII